MNTMNTRLSNYACSLCYRVEPLFTIKCLVLQIPYYLQDGMQISVDSNRMKL